MNPEVLLVTTPAVNFRAFLGACLQVLGYSPARAADADRIIARAAGKDADRLDWTAIHLAEQKRNGMATRVTNSQ